jgi:hypothetical protein
VNISGRLGPFAEVAYMDNALSHIYFFQVDPQLPSKFPALKAISPRWKLNNQEEKNLYCHHDETHKVYSLGNVHTSTPRVEKPFKIYMASILSFAI